MRVLIVGCGYVGLPLGAELVRLGHEVSGLRRSASAENELKAAGIQPLFGDVTQPETLAKLPREFDWVVNCVAAGGGAEDYRQVYLQGTRNLIEWLAPNPPKKFVYTSSTSVYGQTDGSQVKESSPTEPLVETAKILRGNGKSLLLAAVRRTQKFPAVILRVAGIYGPDRGHWFKQFLKNEARMEGDGSRFLNMIHRDDLIGCIIAALKNGRPGEIYNAVDDEPVSQLHFFQWLAQALDKPLPPSEPENPDAKPQTRRDQQARLQPQTQDGTRLSVQVSEFPQRLQRRTPAARPRGMTAHRAGFSQGGFRHAGQLMQPRHRAAKNTEMDLPLSGRAAILHFKFKTDFMADAANRYPENVPGKYYVDNQCIDCDLCRETAPDNFKRNDDGGYSFVFKQPASPEEESRCKEAKEGCPVEAIGDNGA